MNAPASIPHRLRPARGAAEGALVLLHGRGTDELDLLPLIDELDPEGRMVGITPRGPLSLPPGGAHWYVVERVGFPNPSSFHHSYALLAGWLDAMAERTGVPLSRTVIGGFSQGAVMSYALGLGSRRPSPAGILALSGFLPTVPDFELELEGRAGLPVAIGHGTFDPVIGVELGRSACERLEAAGLRVTYREYPLPHAVDPRFLAELRPWLAAAVADAGGGAAAPPGRTGP